MSKKEAVGLSTGREELPVSSEYGPRWVYTATEGTISSTQWTYDWNQMRGRWHPQYFSRWNDLDSRYGDNDFVYEVPTAPFRQGNVYDKGLYPDRSHADSFTSGSTDGTDNTSGGGRCRCTVILVVIGIILIASVTIPTAIYLFSSQGSDQELIGRVDAELTLVRIKFTHGMLNKSSSNFRILSSTFQTEMTSLYRSSALNKTYLTCRVKGLREGSVHVDYSLYFDVVSRKIPPVDQIKEVLYSVDRDVNDRSLGILGDLRFKVGATEFIDQRLVDKKEITGDINVIIGVKEDNRNIDNSSKHSTINDQVNVYLNNNLSDIENPKLTTQDKVAFTEEFTRANGKVTTESTTISESTLHEEKHIEELGIISIRDRTNEPVKMTEQVDITTEVIVPLTEELTKAYGRVTTESTIIAISTSPEEDTINLRDSSTILSRDWTSERTEMTTTSNDDDLGNATAEVFEYINMSQPLNTSFKEINTNTSFTNISVSDMSTYYRLPTHAKEIIDKMYWGDNMLGANQTHLEQAFWNAIHQNGTANASQTYYDDTFWDLMMQNITAQLDMTTNQTTPMQIIDNYNIRMNATYTSKKSELSLNELLTSSLNTTLVDGKTINYLQSDDMINGGKQTAPGLSAIESNTDALNMTAEYNYQIRPQNADMSMNGTLTMDSKSDYMYNISIEKIKTDKPSIGFMSDPNRSSTTASDLSGLFHTSTINTTYQSLSNRYAYGYLSNVPHTESISLPPNDRENTTENLSSAHNDETSKGVDNSLSGQYEDFTTTPYAISSTYDTSTGDDYGFPEHSSGYERFETETISTLTTQTSVSEPYTTSATVYFMTSQIFGSYQGKHKELETTTTTHVPVVLTTNVSNSDENHTTFKPFESYDDTHEGTVKISTTRTGINFSSTEHKTEHVNMTGGEGREKYINTPSILSEIYYHNDSRNTLDQFASTTPRNIDGMSNEQLGVIELTTKSTIIEATNSLQNEVSFDKLLLLSSASTNMPSNEMKHSFPDPVDEKDHTEIDINNDNFLFSTPVLSTSKASVRDTSVEKNVKLRSNITLSTLSSIGQSTTQSQLNVENSSMYYPAENAVQSSPSPPDYIYDTSTFFMFYDQDISSTEQTLSILEHAVDKDLNDTTIPLRVNATADIVNGDVLTTLKRNDALLDNNQSWTNFDFNASDAYPKRVEPEKSVLAYITTVTSTLKTSDMNISTKTNESSENVITVKTFTDTSESRSTHNPIGDRRGVHGELNKVTTGSDSSAPILDIEKATISHNRELDSSTLLSVEEKNPNHGDFISLSQIHDFEKTNLADYYPPLPIPSIKPKRTAHGTDTYFEKSNRYQNKNITLPAELIRGKSSRKLETKLQLADTQLPGSKTRTVPTVVDSANTIFLDYIPNIKTMNMSSSDKANTSSELSIIDKATKSSSDTIRGHVDDIGNLMHEIASHPDNSIVQTVKGIGVQTPDDTNHELVGFLSTTQLSKQSDLTDASAAPTKVDNTYSSYALDNTYFASGGDNTHFDIENTLYSKNLSTEVNTGIIRKNLTRNGTFKTNLEGRSTNSRSLYGTGANGTDDQTTLHSRISNKLKVLEWSGDYFNITTMWWIYANDASTTVGPDTKPNNDTIRTETEMQKRSFAVANGTTITIDDLTAIPNVTKSVKRSSDSQKRDFRNLSMLPFHLENDHTIQSIVVNEKPSYLKVNESITNVIDNPINANTVISPQYILNIMEQPRYETTIKPKWSSELSFTDKSNGVGTTTTKYAFDNVSVAVSEQTTSSANTSFFSFYTEQNTQDTNISPTSSVHGSTQEINEAVTKDAHANVATRVSDSQLTSAKMLYKILSTEQTTEVPDQNSFVTHGTARTTTTLFGLIDKAVVEAPSGKAAGDEINTTAIEFNANAAHHMHTISYSHDRSSELSFTDKSNEVGTTTTTYEFDNVSVAVSEQTTTSANASFLSFYTEQNTQDTNISQLSSVYGSTQEINEAVTKDEHANVATSVSDSQLTSARMLYKTLSKEQNTEVPDQNSFVTHGTARTTTTLFGLIDKAFVEAPSGKAAGDEINTTAIEFNANAAHHMHTISYSHDRSILLDARLDDGTTERLTKDNEQRIGNDSYLVKEVKFRNISESTTVQNRESTTLQPFAGSTHTIAKGNLSYSLNEQTSSSGLSAIQPDITNSDTTTVSISTSAPHSSDGYYDTINSHYSDKDYFDTLNELSTEKTYVTTHDLLYSTSSNSQDYSDPEGGNSKKAGTTTISDATYGETHSVKEVFSDKSTHVPQSDKIYSQTTTPKLNIEIVKSNLSSGQSLNITQLLTYSPVEGGDFNNVLNPQEAGPKDSNIIDSLHLGKAYTNDGKHNNQLQNYRLNTSQSIEFNQLLHTSTIGGRIEQTNNTNQASTIRDKYVYTSTISPPNLQTSTASMYEYYWNEKGLSTHTFDERNKISYNNNDSYMSFPINRTESTIALGNDSKTDKTNNSERSDKHMNLPYTIPNISANVEISLLSDIISETTDNVKKDIVRVYLENGISNDMFDNARFAFDDEYISHDNLRLNLNPAVEQSTSTANATVTSTHNVKAHGHERKQSPHSFRWNKGYPDYIYIPPLPDSGTDSTTQTNIGIWNDGPLANKADETNTQGEVLQNKNPSNNTLPYAVKKRSKFSMAYVNRTASSKPKIRMEHAMNEATTYINKIINSNKDNPSTLASTPLTVDATTSINNLNYTIYAPWITFNQTTTSDSGIINSYNDSLLGSGDSKYNGTSEDNLRENDTAKVTTLSSLYGLHSMTTNYMGKNEKQKLHVERANVDDYRITITESNASISRNAPYFGIDMLRNGQVIVDTGLVNEKSAQLTSTVGMKSINSVETDILQNNTDSDSVRYHTSTINSYGNSGGVYKIDRAEITSRINIVKGNLPEEFITHDSVAAASPHFIEENTLNQSTENSPIEKVYESDYKKVNQNSNESKNIIGDTLFTTDHTSHTFTNANVGVKITTGYGPIERSYITLTTSSIEPVKEDINISGTKSNISISAHENNNTLNKMNTVHRLKGEQTPFTTRTSKTTIPTNFLALTSTTPTTTNIVSNLYQSGFDYTTVKFPFNHQGLADRSIDLNNRFLIPQSSAKDDSSTLYHSKYIQYTTDKPDLVTSEPLLTHFHLTTPTATPTVSDEVKSTNRYAIITNSRLEKPEGLVHGSGTVTLLNLMMHKNNVDISTFGYLNTSETTVPTNITRLLHKDNLGTTSKSLHSSSVLSNTSKGITQVITHSNVTNTTEGDYNIVSTKYYDSTDNTRIQHTTYYPWYDYYDNVEYNPNQSTPRSDYIRPLESLTTNSYNKTSLVNLLYGKINTLEDNNSRAAYLEATTTHHRKSTLSENISNKNKDRLHQTTQTPLDIRNWISRTPALSRKTNSHYNYTSVETKQNPSFGDIANVGNYDYFNDRESYAKPISTVPPNIWEARNYSTNRPDPILDSTFGSQLLPPVTLNIGGDSLLVPNIASENYTEMSNKEQEFVKIFDSLQPLRNLNDSNYTVNNTMGFLNESLSVYAASSTNARLEDILNTTQQVTLADQSVSDAEYNLSNSENNTLDSIKEHSNKHLEGMYYSQNGRAVQNDNSTIQNVTAKVERVETLNRITHIPQIKAFGARNITIVNYTTDNGDDFLDRMHPDVVTSSVNWKIGNNDSVSENYLQNNPTNVLNMNYEVSTSTLPVTTLENVSKTTQTYSKEDTINFLNGVHRSTGSHINSIDNEDHIVITQNHTSDNSTGKLDANNSYMTTPMYVWGNDGTYVYNDTLNQHSRFPSSTTYIRESTSSKNISTGNTADMSIENYRTTTYAWDLWYWENEEANIQNNSLGNDSDMSGNNQNTTISTHSLTRSTYTVNSESYSLDNISDSLKEINLNTTYLLDNGDMRNFNENTHNYTLRSDIISNSIVNKTSSEIWSRGNYSHLFQNYTNENITKDNTEVTTSVDGFWEWENYDVYFQNYTLGSSYQNSTDNIGHEHSESYSGPAQTVTLNNAADVVNDTQPVKSSPFHVWRMVNVSKTSKNDTGQAADVPYGVEWKTSTPNTVLKTKNEISTVQNLTSENTIYISTSSNMLTSSPSYYWDMENSSISSENISLINTTTNATTLTMDEEITPTTVNTSGTVGTKWVSNVETVTASGLSEDFVLSNYNLLFDTAVDISSTAIPRVQKATRSQGTMIIQYWQSDNATIGYPLEMAWNAQNISGWTYIVLEREFTDGAMEVIAIFRAQTMTVAYGNSSLFISPQTEFNNDSATIYLEIRTLKCEDEAIYTLRIYNATSQIENQVTLKLFRPPLVEIVSPDELFSNESLDLVKCTADLGYPFGKLFLRASHDNTNNFETHVVTEGQTIVHEFGTCERKISVSFKGYFKQPVEGSVTRFQCGVFDTDSIQTGGAYVMSELKSIGTISGNICTGKSAGLYPHPFEACRFIECPVRIVKQCPSRTCFDRFRGRCTYQ